MNLLFWLVLLLISAHIFGYLFGRLGMPRVVGEILGGLVLGPTFLGFFGAEGKLAEITYWTGLALLMFISGLGVEKSITKSDGKIILAVITGSTFIPFLAGWFAPEVYDFSRFLGPANNSDALKIVIAIAAAITSIPVISKIFLDLGIIKTRFAKVVLASATVHDIILWVALVVATGMVGATGGALNASIIFGALFAGVVAGRISNKGLEVIKESVKKVSLGIFIPLYFAIVGVKIDLVNHFDMPFFFGFLVFTSVVAVLGTVLASKLIKLDWLPSFNLGLAMTTRGGPGIVLASVAYSAGIINETFFATLVLIAIATSLLAGYWFKFVLSKNWELLK